MRGVVAPIFGLLAVLFIVLGVLNLTVWKPAREVSATTSVSGTRYIVTDSGMLNLLGKSVNVKLSTQGNSTKASSKSDKDATQTCVALGNAKDATGWLAGQNYTRVTGLENWKKLSTKLANGPKITATSGGDEVSFKNSDMWTNVKCGDAAIAFNLNDVKSDQVVIIDTGAPTKKSTQPSVNITMHWVRDKVPNHALPFFIAAGVCVAFTILCASFFAIMANESFRRKREKRRKLREKAKAEEVSISEAMTGSIAVLKTSLTHSSHNHRPSHKIQPSDLAGSASDSATGLAEDGTDASSSSDSSLLSGSSSEGGLSGADGSAPSIIDPTRRNLVADMQMQNNTDNTDESVGSETGVAQSDEPEGGTFSDASQMDGIDVASDDASHGDTASVVSDNAFGSHTQIDGGVNESQSGKNETGRTGSGETDAAQLQSAEPEGSSQTAFTVDEISGHGTGNAETANTDESNHGISRFARHRGKPEQESVSDATASVTSSGRHSRHAARHGGVGSLNDYAIADGFSYTGDFGNHSNADSLGNTDNQGNNATYDSHSNVNDHEEAADYSNANVSVSLDHSEDGAESGDAHHTGAQNSEARTASSADELIDKSHEQAETDVISEDALREYFARLSTETSGGDTADNEAEGAQAGLGTASGTSDAQGDGKNA